MSLHRYPYQENTHIKKIPISRIYPYQENTHIKKIPIQRKYPYQENTHIKKIPIARKFVYSRELFGADLKKIRPKWPLFKVSQNVPFQYYVYIHRYYLKVKMTAPY